MASFFFYFVGLPGLRERRKLSFLNGSCQLFPPTKFYGSNREQISYSSGNPLPHFIWLPTGSAKRQILSTKYNGTVAYINTFNTS